MANQAQPNIPEIFLSPYNPSEHEDNLYQMWNDSGYFNPDNCVKDGIAKPDAEPFTVMLPPPNVTGNLHLGHVYEDSLQDAFVRFHRMQGKRTLWVPGTDSAAIATQARVEKNIQKEDKKSRHDLGREELVKRIEVFAKESEGTILNQIKKVGMSLDWSRYAYALDDERYEAVMTAFTNMYEAGLIYRGNRIVNWDPKGQTTISDDEIVYEERDAKLYTFKYNKDFPITIATTRPETKVGDTAVAVHPEDERYKQYIGQTFDFIFCDVPVSVKVVADKEVDPEFGTGAIGVTPAHSKIDWDIADRANIDHRPQVINEYAKMVAEGRLSGLKVTAAREEVVKWLEEENLLEKTEDIKQNVSTAERTGGIIEPLPKLQWWISVDKEFIIKHSEITGIESGEKISLKELMRKSVENGDVVFPQDRFRKIYFHWIENLHDWCISRQIWFGHRIPAWYKEDEIKVQTNSPGEGWEQEEDVLDTWFSSALWTFSTLGWPEQTKDLETFHPTSFMSPGYEILPLWVSRMILMSGFHLGQVPFKAVMIHGLVRDKQGQKFSKSLKNGTDPLEMVKLYSADALRMSVLMGTAIGNDIRFDEQQVRGYQKFANKLWNISRFVLTSNADVNWEQVPELSERDEEIIRKLKQTVSEVSDEIDKFSLYLGAEKAYHYVWHELADVVLEESKDILTGADESAKYARQYVLKECLITSLKILHPFMPFVTEAVWQNLPKELKDQDILMVAKWPK